MGMAWSRQQGDAARAAAWEHTKRCREQRRLMREAVRMRRQLAASHAGYLKSLGRAASTLTKFALGEPLPVSDHTPPAVLVHRPLAVPSTPPPLLRSIQENQRERELDGAAVVAEAPAPSAAARTEGATVGGEELRMAVRHRSLAEVAAGLEEFFLKASDAGDKVSDILEASNADYKAAHGLGEEAVQGGQGEGAAADQSRQEADGAPGPGVQQEDQRGHPEAQGRVGQGARAAQLGVRGRARDLHGHLRAPGRPARAPGAGALPRHARHVEGDAPAPRGAGPDRAAAARAQQPDVHGPDDGHPARRHEGARGRHVGLVRRPGSPGQAPALLRRGPARLAQADTGADRRRRRRGLLLPCRRGANRIRGPVEAGAGPRALRRGAQVDQELRRRHPRALRAPGRRAPGGAPGRAVHPRAGSQVPDAAAGGEELLRLVRAGAGGVVAVEPGEALDGGRQAGAPRAERGGAAQGGDRRVPEEARGRDEEARQGHRRHQVLGGHRRAGDAAGGVPGHGHLLGVACHRSRGCVQTWQRCALVTYYILKRMERLK